MNTCWQWFRAAPERSGNGQGGDSAQDPFWMIGLCLVLAFTRPWGPCWQLLVNFLHWGHSLTFYLSANYLTFSTYHLLFFKRLEAHPHFDIFFLKRVFIARDAEASPGHPAARSLFAEKISTGLHNHIKKKKPDHVLIAISNILG